jgi:hypothetical protein
VKVNKRKSDWRIIWKESTSWSIPQEDEGTPESNDSWIHKQSKGRYQ